MNRRGAHTICLLLTFLATVATGARAERAPARLRAEYLQVVQHYAGGEHAGAIAAASKWKQPDVLAVVSSLYEIRRSLARPGSATAGGWTQRWVARAVLLQLDLGCEILAPAQPPWQRDFHLSVAERLLDLIENDTQELRDWTRDLRLAVVLRYQELLKFDDLRRALKRGARDYPASAPLAVAIGSLHEVALSPRLAAARELSLVPGEPHLKLAEQSFKRALELDPQLGEARLRLGRVLQQQGRYDEAVAQFARLADHPDGRLRYLAELFVGQIFQRVERIEPACQTPALAVSSLLADAGQLKESGVVVRRVLGARPACDDPWIEYDYGQSRHLPVHMEQLRERLAP